MSVGTKQKKTEKQSMKHISESMKNILAHAEKFGKICGLICFFLFYFLYVLWCLGAFCYTPGSSVFLRFLNAILFLALVLIALFFKPRRYFLAGAVILMVTISLLWMTITPTHNTDWAAEYARLPRIQWQTDQDTFTIHDLRDFHFRTTSDFDIRYTNEEFRISKLKAIDFLAVYWPQPGEEAIAHIMLRFRFDDGKNFLVSSETRRPKGSKYGAINNLYKQSCKIYILATEPDILSLRTNIREPQERVYIYEMALTAEKRETILRDMIAEINDLHPHPQFYNTLTNNCFTELIPSLKAGIDDMPFFHHVYLISGWAPEYFFNAGWLKKKEGETFEELKKRSFLNPATQGWDHQPETYSQLIRKWEMENDK